MLGIKFIFGLFRWKTRGSCVYKETAEKSGSFSIFLLGTLHVNWCDNNLLCVLVVLQAGMTQVATPYWIRFAIRCFDGCEWIASWLSIINYDHILYSSLINAKTKTFPMVCIASKDYNPFMSINTINYKSNQMRSCNCCYSSLQHNQLS